MVPKSKVPVPNVLQKQEGIHKSDLRKNNYRCYLWSETEGVLGLNESSTLLSNFIQAIIFSKVKNM